MVNVWVNDVVKECTSCLRWAMFVCRHRWICLHRTCLVRCACPDIALWLPSPCIVWHCVMTI